MKIKHISDYTPQESGHASEAGSSIFENQNKNLMALYDAPGVYGAMAQLIKLEGMPETVKNDFSVASLLQLMRRHFLTLLSRGALDQFVRFPATHEAREELEKMKTACGQGSVPDGPGDSSSPHPTPTAEELLAQQVVQDWQTQPTEVIRKKKADVPGYAAAIENAVATGQI